MQYQNVCESNEKLLNNIKCFHVFYKHMGVEFIKMPHVVLFYYLLWSAAAYTLPEVYYGWPSIHNLIKNQFLIII